MSPERQGLTAQSVLVPRGAVEAIVRDGPCERARLILKGMDHADTAQNEGSAGDA